MDNDLIIEKSWLKKNWTRISLIVFLAIFLFIILLNANSKNGLADTVSALKEDILYEKAIQIANKDATVLKTIGKIGSIDKLAILEGNTSYTNNNNSVNLSIRINGDKKQAKLDIYATRKSSQWDYQKIVIRTKNPNKEISVFAKP
ncbi:cytochrome c oxidase assembly factor Coa1 family protein [Flavobacterium denitrificans]|uniref:cytochrome c oxidase assembly factor Coa1 family protein n=1 Tax=Flavobacterium denitrificans TaxID=281361 RepID=UPI000415EFF5|nr:cytochrome c oxidase assembly factor Coa1 family protein [Flavobacterium denitrificans]